MRVVVLMIAFMITSSAHAAWRDWWANADQRGIELLNNGNPDQAAETFSDPEWRGTAKFEAGEFEQAAQSFAESESMRALYNRATALAHAGKLKQSLQSFDALLKQEPEHEDGIANREWVIEQLKQQQSEQQNQQQSSGDQEQQNSEQLQRPQNTDNDQQGQQQQAGAQGEDGREASQDNSAGKGQTQAQQSAEDSLKSALEQQLANAEQNEERKFDTEGDEGEGQRENIDFSEIPYDETTQAIEQQLQRIPDDPAGLLRNKIYVTHQSRYADVREGEEPW